MWLRWGITAGLLLLASRGLAAQALHVVDPDGKPLMGARVVLWAPRQVKDPLSGMLPSLAEGETDASGGVPFVLPFRDRLLLFVDHPLFRPLARELTPRPGELRIPLERGRIWQGKVTLDGETFSLGKVCASWRELIPAGDSPRTWRHCADLSRRGDFVLTGLGSPEVEVEVQAPGYLTLRQRVILSSPGALHPRKGVLLHGKVVGPGAGAPIAHAAVQSEGSAPAECAETGAFTIAVHSLPVTLEISAPGFRNRRIAVKERPRKGGLRVSLDPGEQVRGALTDEYGHALAEALVWVEREQPGGGQRSDRRSVHTNQGAFLLDLPEPGIYRFRIQVQGFREETLPDLSIAPGESRSLGTLVLRRGAGVEGLVIDARTGEPLEGVDLELAPEGAQLLDAVLHQRISRTVSDRKGRFSLAGLWTGRFGLTAQRSGYAPAFASTSLDGNRLEDLGTLRMEHGVLLHGKVLDREGNPRPGLAVRFFGPEPGSLITIAERTTGRDGTFEGPSIASGPYRVQVWGGRLLLSQGIDIPANREEWPLELTAGGVHLTGIVTRGGEPVSGGSLSLVSALDPGESRGKVVLSSERAGAVHLGFPETHLTADVRDDGTFELADAPSGALRIDYTSQDSGITLMREAQVPDGSQATLNLEIGGVPLRGRIVDRAQSLGVEGLLRVTDASGSLVASERSSADGEFQVADLQPGRYVVEATADGFAPRVMRAVEVRADIPAIEIPLERGGTGSLRVRMERPDGSPASWIPLALLDQAGRMVRALPTEATGEELLKELPAGLYVLVWSDPFAGTGASEPFQVESGKENSFQKALPKGEAVQLHCDPDLCAGQPIDNLTLSTLSGAQIGPYLSGISTALRFSPAGELTIGRLSPGSYLLQVWSSGHSWNQTFTVRTGSVRVALP